MAGPSSAQAIPWHLLRTDAEGEPSVSTEAQIDVEERIAKIYREFTDGKGGAVVRECDEAVLNREDTVEYLRAGIKQLGMGYTGLDASRPWLVYWITHGLDLLGEPLTEEERAKCIDLLARCQDPSGGFGGGPGQLPHLAGTYAAVSALAVIGTEEAYDVVDRPALVEWMRTLRLDDGSWIMHEDGESDVRGSYCAASVAVLLNVADGGLFDKTADWVAQCQSYDGGIAAVPGTEAHGGYAFCGLAALSLLGGADKIDAHKLASWVVHRQMRFEGGFQGRPHKLVDGCYSFWVGGVFPLLEPLLGMGCSLYSASALQDYILRCCQSPMGGLRDKPGKSRDYYHTCYCLSGLAASQHFMDGDVECSEHDMLQPTDPLHNVVVSKADAMKEFFAARPL